MTTLPQTTSIRLPRPSGPGQLAPSSNGVPALAGGGTIHAPATANLGLTGADIWRIIRGHLWLIALTIIVSGVAGYGINYFLAQKYPAYTGAGYIQVQPKTRDIITEKGHNDTIDTNLLSIEQKTQAQLLGKSEALLSKVLSTQSGDIRDTRWFKRFNGDIKAAKEDFWKRYSVTPIPETRLVKVEFEWADPRDCQVVVMEMGEQHIKDQAEQIFLEGQQRSQQLNALKTKYRMEYQENEAKLARSRGSVARGGGGVMNRVNMKEMELQELRRNKSTVDLNYKAAQGQLDGLNQMLQAGQVPPTVIQALNQTPEVAQSKALADQLEQQLAAARDRFGDGNQQVQLLQKQYERAKQSAEDKMATNRIQLIDAYRDQLSQQAGIAKKSLEEVNAQIEQLQQDLGEVTEEMVRYYTLESQQRGVSDLLKQVQDQLDVLDAEQQQKLQGKVSWNQKPEVPTNPTFPKLWASMTIAISFGVILGLSIAFIRELTDTTIRSTRDIQRVGQINLLGMVGDETQDPQAAGARLPLVIFDAPHSMTAEQLRQVRTRLQHAASLDTTRSLLVTSPSPGDGKTTIACNLAAGLALNGRRILLVDGNFRRPEIHRVFGLNNEQGFSDVLNGSVTFDEVVQETQVPNLAVMTAGPKPINATEMFESQLLIDFIERALEEFDHVIFDSGPMMVVSESAAMASRVDGVVTVVRARSNSRGLLQRMRDTLRANKAENLGVVLNGVRAQGGGYLGRNIKTYYEYQNG
jgi:capsular exopolysaccharide synthesis family protein